MFLFLCSLQEEEEGSELIIFLFHVMSRANGNIRRTRKRNRDRKLTRFTRWDKICHVSETRQLIVLTCEHVCGFGVES